ncbi:hypothetical protein BDZ45DRAFT_671452 [Acephala macrosclerotiorum]|nr:hypothetical protein BDZ45DRAFT_671452 [Acephala macrosclerotiorum]
MDFFTKLFRGLSLSREYPDPVKLNHALPRPLAFEFSPFSKLPSELLLQIVDHLPPESKVMFAICCRPHYFMFRKSILQTLWELDSHGASHPEGFESIGTFPWRDFEGREKILFLLEKDLPDHIVCTDCGKLHVMATASRHLPSTRSSMPYNSWLPCWKKDEDQEVTQVISSEFSSTVFLMIMKAYRQHRIHLAMGLLSLISSPVEHLNRGQYTRQIDGDFGIIKRSLFFRERRRFIDCDSWFDFGYDPNELIFCPHHVYPTKGSIEAQSRRGILSCTSCHTDFQIDRKRYFDRLGVEALFVTRWLDLGEGRLRSDPKWIEHFVGDPDEPTRIPSKRKKGSVCKSFEGKSHKEWEFDSIITLADERALITVDVSRRQRDSRALGAVLPTSSLSSRPW